MKLGMVDYVRDSSPYDNFGGGSYCKKFDKTFFETQCIYLCGEILRFDCVKN